MRKVFSVSIGLFLGAVSFGPAQAEVLPVDGIYPAGIDAAIPVERIAIESFDGDSGTALSFAITDALQAVVIDGQPWFQVVPSTGGAAGSIYIIESDQKGGGSPRTVEVDPGFDAVLGAGLEDARIVRRHDGAQGATLRCPLRDTHHHGQAGNVDQRFVRQAAGRHARRNQH